jgi:hypothetical protein
MVDIEKERMRAALKLIAEKSCERLTTGPGSCWSQPAWTPEAQYSDDRWCDGCIALAAILPPSQQRPIATLTRATPNTHESP